MWHQVHSVFVLVLCVLLACCSLGYTASVRNPSDLDDIIDLDHEYLTYGSYHDDDDVIDSIQYYFRSEKGGYYSPLRRNLAIDLNSPLCYVDDTSKNIICEYGNKQNINFYRNEDNTVAVAIANENGTMQLKGIVNTDNSTTEIEPLVTTDLPPNRYHIIKKRWTANIVRQKVKPYQPYVAPSGSAHKQLPSSESNRGYCIDVMCVVDYSIYKKFKDTEKTDKKAVEKIRYYYAHVINGINMRYSTIAQKDLSINVRLAGYFIAKKPNDLPFIDADKMANDPRYRVNSNYTLTGLDSFLKRKQKSRTSVLPDFNHAMLFLEYAQTNLGGSVLGSTDHHIDESAYKYAFQHGEPKDGVSGDDGGTSFVSGICSDSKSTSLVVDHGAYTSAGIGCHELGHNLGVYWHDGEGTARGSACNASLNYIMAPSSYLIDDSNLQYSFLFSKCSTQQIKSHLDTLVKLNRNCLQCSQRGRKSRMDVQIDSEVEGHMDVLPGEVDNVHVQCKQLYGEGSFMCPPKSPEEMCYRMYCYDPKRSACAIISEQMAATGTPCGKYKICKMGKCVSDKKGTDVPDDCPYPDIPSDGAHCEDATPFMCKNEKFKQKCCISCNKKFSAEEACKDSHIRINGMACSQLMVSVFGRPGCASDFNVQNMCCLSCKRLLATSSSNSAGVMIHIGIGSQLGQQAPSFRQRVQQSFGSSGGIRSNSISNKMTSSRSKFSSSSRQSQQQLLKQQQQQRHQQQQRQQQQQPPYRVPYKPTPPKVIPRKPPLKAVPGSCIDGPITFNQISCRDIGKKFIYYCKNSQVQRMCCKSCWPHRNK